MYWENLQKTIQESKYDDNFFADTCNLDPSKVDETWDKLAVNQTLVNLKFLPQTIALAFVDTLKERGYLK